MNNVYKLFHGLYVDKSRLIEMLKAFYMFTHLKISFFDTEFNQLQEWPLPQCEFCQLIRRDEIKACLKCDAEGFMRCHEKKDVHSYQCHAGLMDMIIPIKLEEMIIGYIMFGQLIRAEKAAETKQHLFEIHRELANEDELRRVIDLIDVRSEEELEAATLIGKACISYLLNERVVSVDRNNLVDRIDSYIIDNMAQGFSVEDLCTYLNMKRSSFYSLTNEGLGCSIGDYIRKKRVETAKSLLKDTDLPVSTIAEKVGFCDYNYFLRSFKKQVGVTCRAYRRNVKDCQHIQNA
ncbi:MAG: PocR ligand-binding domain-containing protein [Oscillospiraceae bacterium]